MREPLLTEWERVLSSQVSLEGGSGRFYYERESHMTMGDAEIKVMCFEDGGRGRKTKNIGDC